MHCTEWLECLSDTELAFIKKRMLDNYVRVKRVNFQISESYLKDSLGAERVLRKRQEKRYLEDKKKAVELKKILEAEEEKRLLRIKEKAKRYGRKRFFIKEVYSY